MNLDDPDDRSVAAAEYVLGTLDVQTRALVEARMAHDPALRQEVYAWQDRLLPLASRVAGVQPDEGLWGRIAAGIGSRPPTHIAAPIDKAPAANDPVLRRLQQWRATALLALAASIVLAALLVLRPPADPARYLTLLETPDTHRTGWVVEAIEGDRIRLVPVTAPESVPAGKSLQFWTKPQGASGPTSLGLVRPGMRVEFPVARSPSVGEQQLFELTLEPEAGSPTGLPTGPILFVGRSVRL